MMKVRMRAAADDKGSDKSVKGRRAYVEVIFANAWIAKP